MKNNQKGITLIALVITIIVTMILATVTINIGTGGIENSRMTAFVTYMQVIQSKVDYIVQNEDYTNYGEILSEKNKETLQEILKSENENFLTTADSSDLRYFSTSKIASDLEIENIEDEIVIDFNTREVISLNGIEYEGKMYYTQYNLPGGQVLKQQTEQVTRNVGFVEIEPIIDGLNARFLIKNIGISNGTLSFGKQYINEDEQPIIKWKTITNYTTEGESITTENVTETGTYYFKIVDNVTGRDNADNSGNYPSVEIKLTNVPKLQGNLTDLTTTYNYSNLNDSSKWAFATDKTDTANVKYYIWIPRYVYKLDETNKLEELQFLRGTSDITTSGGYINRTEWLVPDVFADGLKTGVWVQVDIPNKDRCRYNRCIRNRNNIIINVGASLD